MTTPELERRGKSLKAYQEGRFDYNECFFGEGGFLTPDSNEEKHMMSYYMQVLAEELAKKGVVFGTDKPIRWLEPGIGDGSSTIKFIQAIAQVHKAGFILHGSDYQQDSVEEAHRSFGQLKGVKVSVAELAVKDAFSGDRLAAEFCDYAMLSHFIYHIKNQLNGDPITHQQAEEKMYGLIKGVMGSLDKNGLALAFHESPSSDMFGKIGLNYGSAMNDATDRIAKAASANGKTIVRMPLESKLYFPALSIETIDSFKKLDNWRNHPEGTPEAGWLKKLLFALHNTPQKDEHGVVIEEGGIRDLAKEPGTNSNETRLGDTIDFVKSLLQRDERGAYITIRSEMQAILNNPELEAPVREAFAEVERRLPEIRIRTSQAMSAAARNARIKT